MYFSCWSNSSFSASLLLPVFLFFSFCWSKYPVFYLFAPIQLASLFCLLDQIFFFQLFPKIQLACLFCLLEQISCFSSLCPSSASSSSFAIGANILHIHTLLQAYLLLPSACWSKHSIFLLFPPKKFSLNPASIQPQINLRLHSNHLRSGLTSASSVYRWIRTLQV